jgi:leucyl aminopeptidase
MLNCFAAGAGTGARPVHVVPAAGYRDWLRGQPGQVRAWLEGGQFEAKAGRSALLPGTDGAPGAALLLHSEPAEPWDFAALRDRLPAGDWRLEPAAGNVDLGAAALGWALASYRFERYR